MTTTWAKARVSPAVGPSVRRMKTYPTERELNFVEDQKGTQSKNILLEYIGNVLKLSLDNMCTLTEKYEFALICYC